MDGHRTNVGEGSGLLERERELRAIDAALLAVAGGARSVLTIEGSAGVGKTSLLEVAGERARVARLSVLRAGCHHLVAEVPGRVVRQLLAPVLEGAGPTERRRLLRGLGPAIRPLLQEGSRARAVESADPSAGATISLAMLLDRTLAASPQGSVVLIDDAQWGDAVSLRALSYVMGQPGGAPCAVMLALRDEASQTSELHALRAARAARTLRPGALSAGSVGALVRRRLPEAEPVFCDLVAEASAGNPFLVSEMVRAVRDDGLRGSAAEATRLAGFVPDSVLSAVLARLARLSADAGTLAQAASVLAPGRLRQVAALAQLAPADADRAADELVAAGFLCRREPVVFAHPLVRMAVYGDHSTYANARAHRRAAAILDADGAPTPVVAAHARLARPDADDWVVGRLRAAAAVAVHSGDPATAASLLERAREEPPDASQRPGVLLELADARALCGADGAVECARDAVALLDAAGPRAEALQRLGRLLLARLDLAGAAACAEQGLAELTGRGPLPDALEGILLASAVLVPELHERVDARIAQLRREALHGDDPRDPVTLATLALRMSDEGDDRRVINRLVRGALQASADDPLARAATINQVGSALVFCEDLAGAERELSAVVDRAQRDGDVLTAGFARVWRGHARLRTGRLSQARADAERALELRHFGWQFHVGPCLAALAEALHELGDGAGAQAAVELGERTLVVDRQPLVLAARARLATADGRPRDAESDVLTAQRFLHDTHGLDNPVILPWRSLLARARARLGERDEAVALALAEAERAREVRSDRAEGVALATAGALARGAEGIELLQRAEALLAQTDAALEHARALTDLGAALRRGRRRADAREPLRRALAVATELDATALAQRASDELRSTGAHPRRVALHGADSLTPTERRIAELAAEGLSNRAIADALVVAGKTVEWHLSRIYAKLDVKRRGELAAALSPRPDDRPASPVG